MASQDQRGEMTKMPGTHLRRSLFLSLALSIFFCGCFALIYPKLTAKPSAPGRDNVPLILTGAVVGRRLPQVDFVDADNKVVDATSLDQGKIVMVVVSSGCSACGEEIKFLKDVLKSNTHIEFYGLLAYSDIRDLSTDRSKYPFKLLYDRSGRFIKELGIDRTPVKLFCDGGVIKKVWVGSTDYEPDQISFSNWLASVR
jgi:hypothetical protein